MLSNNYYRRSFIILQARDRNYNSSDGKEPAGYCKMEVRKNKVQAYIYIQNLKEGSYDVFVISNIKGVLPQHLVSIQIGDRGRGEFTVDFDTDNVCGSGHSIEKYNSIAVIDKPQVSTANIEIKYPLVGFANKRINVDWTGQVTPSIKSIYEKINFQYESEKEKTDDFKQADETLITKHDEHMQSDSQNIDREEIDSRPTEKDTADNAATDSVTAATEKGTAYNDTVDSKTSAVKATDSGVVDTETSDSEVVDTETSDSEVVDTEASENEETDTATNDNTAAIDDGAIVSDSMKDTEEDNGDINETLSDDEAVHDHKDSENFDNMGNIEDENQNLYEDYGYGDYGDLFDEYDVNAIDFDKAYNRSVYDSIDKREKQEAESDTYWSKVKDYFEGLFDTHLLVNPFEEDMGDAKWVRVQQLGIQNPGYYMRDMYSSYYPGYVTQDHYIVGLIKEKGQIKYVVYGIPGLCNAMPPMGMIGFYRWTPMRNGYGLGYWLIYIDAHTGHVTYPF